MAERGQQGHVEEAVRLRPNLWRVRFALSPEGALELYFDGARRQWRKTETVQGLEAGPVPAPGAQ